MIDRIPRLDHLRREEFLEDVYRQATVLACGGIHTRMHNR
jgi:hypothetical protein